MVSDASSEVKPEGESVEVSGGEKKKLALKESPISNCTSAAIIENGDDMKEPEILKLNESPSGDKGGDGKYFPHSETPPNVPNAIVDDLVHENVEEVQETKMQVEHSNGKQSWRSREKDMSSAFRRPNPYPDEGPSNYHHNPAKRNNLDGPSSTEHIDQDRAEILKKLDELRDQLRRSCEISQKPKARPSACRTTTFSSNPYARNGRNNWFPEGSSLLNRTSSRHSPFMNGHSIDLPNLYPAVPSQNGIPGYREVYGPHSFGRAPFHPAGHYPRPMGNCLHGQFDPDPLVSYHHDGFYHQPACSCLHCCNTHWPSVYSNQRVPYHVSNHGFYQADGPSVLGQQNYNQRDANGPLSSNEPRYRQRPMFMKKDGRTCRPVAGAAPFVSCSNCSELLQVPEDTLRLGKSRHKLRCGSCSYLISLDYDGGKLVTSAPSQATNVDSENNKDSNNGNNGHMNRHSANSYPGSFDSTGYEGHSEDEKLVLPSYPVSSNEMIEKGYGFHLSEAEKMQGLSSSPSISEDLDSQDSVVCQRDVPSSSELPPEARGLSRVPSLPLREHFGYSLSSEVVDGPGNGSRSRRSDQEKIVSMNGNFKQNSVKDVPVASEMDLSSDEYPDAGFSQESWEACRDEDQPQAKNSKSGESFFAGLIKKSFKFNQSTENSRCKVFINGHPISDRLVKKAEKLAGPIHPGNYWYAFIVFEIHCGFFYVAITISSYSYLYVGFII